MAKMREMPIDDFMTNHGKLRIDGRVLRDMYLYEVKKPSESKYPWDYLELCKPFRRTRPSGRLMRAAVLSQPRIDGASLQGQTHQIRNNKRRLALAVKPFKSSRRSARRSKIRCDSERGGHERVGLFYRMPLGAKSRA
jgi:hypothetical protein